MNTLSALSALPLALLGFTTLAGCSAPPGDGASSSFGLPVVSESAKDGFDAPSLAAGTLQMVGAPTFKLGTGADTTIALDVRLDGTIVATHTTCSLDGCNSESIPSAISMTSSFTSRSRAAASSRSVRST